VLDMAGSVTEWTSSQPKPGIRILRGGNWFDTPSGSLVDFNAIENQREESYMLGSLGLRCVSR